MTISLNILAYGKRMGEVSQDTTGKFTFRYDGQWPTGGTFPLSLSMPSTQELHPDSVVRPFLQGLLPDNDRVLEHWGRRFGVSPRNPLALLAYVGEDCAGAIQLVRPERLEVITDPDRSYIDWITEFQVAERLRALSIDDTAWQAPQREGQFSLAGAQPKIALLLDQGRWGVPNGAIPTTHILKPPTGSFDGFAENEHLCLTLARRIGLPVASSTVQKFDDQLAVVIKRYDRIQTTQGILRYHQEDCCQALGVSPFIKYENEGGPGLKLLVQLLQQHSDEPVEDVRTFVKAVAFNWIIGGTDAHAKNFSILLGANNRVRLAPLYDIATALPYHRKDLMKLKLAMRIGGEYLLSRINASHWERMARESQLSGNEVLMLVRDTAEGIRAAILDVGKEIRQNGLTHPILGEIEHLIHSRALECGRLMQTGI